MTDLAAWLATHTRPPRDPIADFLHHHPGEGLTPDQYTALLTEEEAHRENRRRDENAA